MSGARPNLHVVGSAPEPATTVPSEGDGVSPETVLRTLFKREAKLERQLVEVRQSIQGQRGRYARKHRLGCFPAIDHLRRLFI